MSTYAQVKRDASFWAGFDKEKSDLSIISDRIIELYDHGPRTGGRTRSEVARLLGVDFHAVDHVIKAHMRKKRSEWKQALETYYQSSPGT